MKPYPEAPVRRISRGDLDDIEVAFLSQIERRASWLAAWTIHNANHVRQGDEIKVGGHQPPTPLSVRL